MANPNENTLWMGDLEPYMDERFIFQAFKQMGEDVVKVKLVSSKHSRGFAGYCFVEFTDSDAAHKAMLRLNSKVIPGSAPPKRFKLNRASFGREHLTSPEFSLFVGDVSEDIDDYKLYTMFSSKYVSCKSAKVVLDSAGKSRGYGFVRFMDETDQQRALIEMQGYSGINRKPLRVSLATPKKSFPNDTSTSHYDYMSHSFYQQQPYPNYPYYAWWQAYQQPMDATLYYGPPYVGNSYCYPEQAAAASVLLSEVGCVAASTPEDDETSDPEIAADVLLCNLEFIEKSEEFYSALDESRWHPLDNVCSAILST